MRPLTKKNAISETHQCDVQDETNKREKKLTTKDNRNGNNQHKHTNTTNTYNHTTPREKKPNMRKKQLGQHGQSEHKQNIRDETRNKTYQTSATHRCANSSSMAPPTMRAQNNCNETRPTYRVNMVDNETVEIPESPAETTRTIVA